MRRYFELTPNYYKSLPQYQINNLTWVKKGFQHIKATEFFKINNGNYTENVDIKAELLTLINEKLLAVYDSNHAHHFTYYLVERALELHNLTNANLVVLNFDQHQDYKKRKEYTKMKCGNWGAFINDLFQQSSIIKTYINYNNSEKTDLGIYIGTLYEEISRDNDIIKKLPNYFTNGKKNYLYITVDLDVLTGKRTDYSPGKLALRKLVEDIYLVEQFIINTKNTLNIQIIGADVNGLPPSNISGTDYKQYIEEAEMIVEPLEIICCNGHIPYE